ncbi:MAG TPA: tetratricopeptide repeat protein [Candidatus Hydrogenedentes bacterium]|nr:tetratricopeptide repeat protein [Candidatus Hydrogenedentota bacterium]HPG67458.1 tetratricopeptide repeat protein [Candidatus Hydrogenedentota bacterium]
MQVFGGENAESYYDEGVTALVKGDVTKAGQCFNRALQLDDSFVAARHQLGKCYMRIGKVDRAAHLFRKVLAEKPDLLAAKMDLGHALLEQGHLEEARKQFIDVVDAQPNHARAHYGLARVAFDAGNWESAMALAMEARSRGGDHFSTLLLLGRAARLAGADGLALESLKSADALIEKSIESNPDQPGGYFLRGEVAFAQEQYKSAIEYYREADKRAEREHVYFAYGEEFTREDIRAKWGLCLQRLGDLVAARELGRRILRRLPDHKLGQALAELDDSEE